MGPELKFGSTTVVETVVVVIVGIGAMTVALGV
jgi:hypothetical protein